MRWHELIMSSRIKITKFEEKKLKKILIVGSTTCDIYYNFLYNYFSSDLFLVFIEMSNEGTRPKPLSRASLMSTRATGCHRQLRLQLVSNFIICESDKWRNRRFSITQLVRNRRSFYKCSARGPDFSNGTCWQLRFMMTLLHTLIIVYRGKWPD